MREGRTHMGQAIFKRPRLDQGTAGVLLAHVAADPLWSLSTSSPAFTQISTRLRGKTVSIQLMASAFHGPIDAHNAIVGPHCGPGGVMNFNFGSGGTLRYHCLTTVWLTGIRAKAQTRGFLNGAVCARSRFCRQAGDYRMVAQQVRGSGSAGSAGGPWRDRVRRHQTSSAHTLTLTDCSKSQLALQYVHSIRHARPQTFVFWVHASTRARFEEAYKDIAERLQLPERSDPKTDVLRLVSDWLLDETNWQWVMVVDNADDLGAFCQRDEADAGTQTPLATFLPQSVNGAILVTSRSKDAAFRLVGGYNNMEEVLAMNDGEGLQLLRNKLRHPPAEDSALELLRELDHIPLAISQAAAYIGRRARMTVTRYVEELRKSSEKRESLLRWDAGELRRDASASNSVVTTWMMSFEQLRRERRSAAELLSLMSFFNPQKIPETTLRHYRKHLVSATGARDEKEEEDIESAFDEDLDTLQAYSLVSIMADADTCKMHASVQFCTRVWLASLGDAEQRSRCS